jgi:uncharacterized protein (TIGR02677 family)
VGARIQRDVNAILATAEGAREVSRELLGLIARGLTELADRAVRDGKNASPTDMAERVSTLFLQFGEFASSISDFYAYIGSVVSRFDLDSDEFNGFKALLLDYLDTVVNDVATYTPAIERALTRLWPALPHLLTVLSVHGADFRALQGVAPGPASADHARGRSEADWEELRQWFSDGGVASGAYQLRSAASRALSALLANLKRINSASSRAASYRRDLVKLARWFSVSTSEEAHGLFNAAFCLHGARHLGTVLGEDGAVDPTLIPATTSWWKAPRAPVPVSLRDRGDRSARGRSSRPQAYAAQKERLLEGHARDAAQHRDAIAELAAAAPRLAVARLSGPAIALLVDLFASAMAAGELDIDPTRFRDGMSHEVSTGLVLTVKAAPGASTTVRSATGTMTFYDLALHLVAADQDLRQAEW